MGTYLYATAAAGRTKATYEGEPITVFPMAWRWKYGQTHAWSEYNRQDFHLARIERAARKAIARVDYEGLIAPDGIRQGAYVVAAEKDEALWADGDPFPGTVVGWLDKTEGGWIVQTTGAP